jgi:hypothetical protein
MKPADLEGMTSKELRVLAAAKGVARASKLTKAELIDVLTTKPKTEAKASGPGKAGAAKGGIRAPSRRRKQATFTSTVRPELAMPSSHLMAPPAPPPVNVAGPNPGLPIPGHYGQDRLVLMVQDPNHVFAYWELSPDTLQRAQAEAGAGSTPVLVIHTGHGEEFREVDLRGGNYYLAVAPAGSYEAQLALRDAKGRLHPLARSNKVTTPTPTISTRLDEQWMGVDETFHELLELAGLPGHMRLGTSASAARLADRSQEVWTWHEAHLQPLSSGALSSHSLSSRALVK